MLIKEASYLVVSMTRSENNRAGQVGPDMWDWTPRNWGPIGGIYTSLTGAV